MRDLVKGLQLYELPSYQEIIATKTDDYIWDRTFAEAENDPILICHTSGSTGEYFRKSHHERKSHKLQEHQNQSL